MTILDCIGHLYDFEAEDFKCCVSSDIVEGDDLKVVLLFESPHLDELKPSNPQRLPAVGATGRSVTKLLDALVHQTCPVRRQRQVEPIGRLCGRSDTGFAWLGLMNACQIPLQKKAYGSKLELQQSYATLLADLQAFKGQLDGDEDADIIRGDLGRAIAGVLAERVEPVQQRGLLLVPCGRIARALCAAAKVRVDRRLPRVPHPVARDAWGHAPALVEMAKVIRSVLLD